MLYYMSKGKKGKNVNGVKLKLQFTNVRNVISVSQLLDNVAFVHIFSNTVLLF